MLFFYIIVIALLSLSVSFSSSLSLPPLWKNNHKNNTQRKAKGKDLLSFKNPGSDKATVGMCGHQVPRLSQRRILITATVLPAASPRVQRPAASLGIQSFLNKTFCPSVLKTKEINDIFLKMFSLPPLIFSLLMANIL